MTRELPAQRVEVGFVGAPPVRAVERIGGDQPHVDADELEDDQTAALVP